MKRELSYLKNNHIFSRFLFLLIGTFIMTIIYNKFLMPNNIVTGGTSGLAIVIKELTGLSTTIFINISNVVLVVLSFIFLGKKKTLQQLVGCIVYLVMLNITMPLANSISFEFKSEMLMIALVSIFWGVGNGLIWRAGYSTGGTDFLSQIFAEKFHQPVTTFSLIIQLLVLASSLLVCSVPKILMAILIIYVSNKITNMILFGQSTSKMIYVVSEKNNKIEDYIMNEINTGATEIKVSGGVLSRKRQMLMCVVHNAQYEKFKHKVLELDKDAFILANNCYEVSGGKKYNLLPF